MRVYMVEGSVSWLSVRAIEIDGVSGGPLWSKFGDQEGGWQLATVSLESIRGPFKVRKFSYKSSASRPGMF